MKIIYFLIILSISGCNTAFSVDNGDIPDNFDKIDLFVSQTSKLTNSFRVIKKDILDNSLSEGCELKGFFDLQGLRLIDVVFYGETSKIQERYYLKNEKLVFLEITEHVYDKPIYMKDFKVKHINKTKYYFFDNISLNADKIRITHLQEEALLNKFNELKQLLL